MLEMHLSSCKRRAISLLRSHRVSMYRAVTLTSSRTCRRRGGQRRYPEEAEGKGMGENRAERNAGNIFRRCNECAQEPFVFPLLSRWLHGWAWCGAFLRGAVIKDPVKVVGRWRDRFRLCLRQISVDFRSRISLHCVSLVWNRRYRETEIQISRRKIGSK